MHFLAELGVVPQTSNAKTDRTNRLKADLFYKLNKWVVVSWLYTHDLQHPPALSQLVGLLGIVCIVSCCPKLLEPPVHLLSVFAGGTTFDISLFQDLNPEPTLKRLCTLTRLVLSAALLCGCCSMLAVSLCCCSRFNALREENEGFSKMLVCLQGFGAAAAAKSEDIPQLVRSSSLDCTVSFLLALLIAVS